MKKFAVGLFLTLGFLPFLLGQKIRFGQVPPKAKVGVDYPIAVHIHEIHLRKDCEYNWESGIIGGPRVSCPDVVYLEAVMDGKKVELLGQSFQKLTINPGDCQARVITKKASNADSPAMGMKYELLLPEKYIWRSLVTGIGD